MANPQRLLAQVVSGGVLCGALSCDNAVAPALKLDDHVGMYALAQVDGHQLGWYHQMGAVDCSAAFTHGGLTIGADKSWRMALAYDFRCLGTHPFDSSDTLFVVGYVVRPSPQLIVLNGFGPDMIGRPANWSIEVRPLSPDSLVEVRFLGAARDDWGDPVLTLGPQKPLDGSCFIRC